MNINYNSIKIYMLQKRAKPDNWLCSFNINLLIQIDLAHLFLQLLSRHLNQNVPGFSSEFQGEYSGFSFKNSFAFSRPWPILSSL